MDKKEKSFAVKEAEQIIENYIKNNEKYNKRKVNKNIGTKYKILKFYAAIVTIVCILAIII